MDFCKYLLKEAHVACAPGIAYHAEGHVRISLGGERTNEAIDRIVGCGLETFSQSKGKESSEENSCMIEARTMSIAFQ